MTAPPTPAAAAAAAADNAFVGPQPLPADRTVYGRDRELLALANRLLSDRVVLLYSPSGAGKTSLIQAANGVRHRMRDEGLWPLPIVRLAQGADVAARLGVNRYLLSALMSLDEDPAAGRGRSPDALAALIRGPADDFLDRHLRDLLPAGAGGDGAQAFLVFDQFEELLTLHPTDDDHKRAFLRQVGVALRDPDRWALFAMREDHAAALDPYLPLLPTRLRATFRLGLLDKAQAAEAVRGPAAEPRFGVTFDPAAVDRLVRDLARVQAQDPRTGRSEPGDGLYVEPLHLQVVCQQLWEAKPPAARSIGSADIDALTHGDPAGHGDAGDAGPAVGPGPEPASRGVDAALAHYYDRAVAAVAVAVPDGRVTERAIRNWFGRAAISPGGLRLPVLLTDERQYGLDATALRALADRYLLRCEPRHGSYYYEVAHDRLVGPIRQSNAAWRRRHLGAFQRQAEAWRDAPAAERPKLLAAGPLLREGERLARAAGEPPAATASAAGGRADFSPEDAAYLAACRQARRDLRHKRGIAGLVALCLLVAAALALWVRANGVEKRRADAVRQYARALEALGGQPTTDAEQAARRAIDALKAFGRLGEDPPALLRDDLLPHALGNWFGEQGRTSLWPPAGAGADRPQQGGPGSAILELVAAGPDDRWLVARTSGGTVLCWADPYGPGVTAPTNPRQIPFAACVAVTPDARHLVVGHTNGQVCRWDMEAAGPDQLGWRQLAGPSGPGVTAVDVMRAAGPSHWAAAGYADGSLRLFDLRRATDPQQDGPGYEGEGGAWAATRPRYQLNAKRPEPPRVTSVVVTPAPAPGRCVVTARTQPPWKAGGQDAEWASWEAGPAGGGPPAPAAAGPAAGEALPRDALVWQNRAVALSVAGSRVTILAGHDGPGGRPASFDLPGGNKIVRVNATLSTGGAVYVNAWDGGGDWAAYRWAGGPAATKLALAEPTAQPAADDPTDARRQRASPVSDAAFGRDGNRLAVGRLDGTASVWDLASPGQPPLVVRAHAAQVCAVRVGGPAARWLFTAGLDGTLRRWDLNRVRSVDRIRDELTRLSPERVEAYAEDVLAGRTSPR